MTAPKMSWILQWAATTKTRRNAALPSRAVDLGLMRLAREHMKQTDTPNGQILEEFDGPDAVRDAVQDLLNDRLIEFRGTYRDGSPIYYCCTSVSIHELN